MDEIIKTRLLEYDKSTFLIDLILHCDRHFYISINQIIHIADSAYEQQTIKINPSILDDLIETLTTFQAELPQKSNKSDKGKYFTKEKEDELVRRYFKGIAIQDLALQFGCSGNIVEQILRNSGIEIVSNDIQDYSRTRRKKNKGGWKRTF